MDFDALRAGEELWERDAYFFTALVAIALPDDSDSFFITRLVLLEEAAEEDDFALLFATVLFADSAFEDPLGRMARFPTEETP